jgi:transcriptional regulator with XRE-family HTH domain
MQTEVTRHEGRNVKRIREIMGIKQEALAVELGISQQAISALEQREALDKDTLDKVAQALKVSPEAIRNFNEESLVTNISCNFNDQAANFHYNFNPVERWVEALDENKKLYERLLQSEKEKVELLQEALKGRGQGNE